MSEKHYKQYQDRYLSNEQLAKLRELMELAAAADVDSILEELHYGWDVSGAGDFPVIDQAAYEKIVREVYESVYKPFSTPGFEDMEQDAYEIARKALDESL